MKIYQIGVILLLALGLRLALWGQPLHEPANDENEYITVAYDLIAGRGWEFYTHYRWLRAPLYPLFLAGSLWLTQGNLHRAALPNIVLSVGTVYLIYRYTQTLQRYKQAAIIQEHSQAVAAHIQAPTYTPLLAALLAALLCTFSTFASLYMSETLFSFLFLAAFLVLLHEKQQYQGVIWAGLLYGLATLTRSVSFAFLPVVLVWIVLKQQEDARAKPQRMRNSSFFWFRAVLPAGVFLIAVFLPILPWTIHNCQAYGRCILIETGLSFNLWAFSEPHEDIETIYRTLEGIPNPADRADEATRRGMERLREDPTILLRKPWPNWVALWRVKPIQDRFLVPNYYVDPPPVVFLGALIFDDMGYVVILVASVVGISCALKHPHTRHATLLPALWIVYIVMTTMLTHGEGRYRHFLFPMMIPFAAMALVQCVHWLVGKKVANNRFLHTTNLFHKVYRLATGTLIVVLLYTVVMSYPWEWAAQGAIRSMYRIVGDIAFASGNLTKAEKAYLQAYAAQRTADGQLLLGNLYHLRGEREKAEKAYRSAWSIKRRYVATSASLGNFLREEGRNEEARTAFKGYFVEEHDVMDWSWNHLQPIPVASVDVGNGLDFGYVQGFYQTEMQQGATARWSTERGLIRMGKTKEYTASNVSPILSLRMAAPHHGKNSVAVEVCVQSRCQPIETRQTWRVVTLLIPYPKERDQMVVELLSPTFAAPNGRHLGVLVDWIAIRFYE